jgi:competence protein ComEC
VPSLSVTALGLIALGGLWLGIWLGTWRWWGLAPIALGLLSLVVTRPPDLLISGDMRLIAVRASDGAYLPSTAHGTATIEDTWTRRAAAELGSPWPESGSSADGILQCDAEGCFYRARGQTVALIRDGAALAEDCHAADLVVSPIAAHRACHGVPIIDRIDTYRLGGHAVWLDSGGITIETVRDWQGDRPWSPRRGSYSEGSQ